MGGFKRAVRAVIRKDKESKNVLVHQFIADPIGTTVTSINITDIDQGSANTNREGEQCYLQAFGARLAVEYEAASSAQHQWVRLIIYKPYQLNALQTSFTVFSTIDPAQCHVLYDKLFFVSPEFPAKVLNVGRKFRSKFFPQGTKLIYSGSSGDDIEKNAYYMAIVSDQATSGPRVYGNCRTYFKEC